MMQSEQVETARLGAAEPEKSMSEAEKSISEYVNNASSSVTTVGQKCKAKAPNEKFIPHVLQGDELEELMKQNQPAGNVHLL